MNDDLKMLMRKSRFFNYEIARQIGVKESVFSTWFRTPISEDRAQQIIEAIRILGGETDDASSRHDS